MAKAMKSTELLNKRLQYSKLVKETYKPKVSERKRTEMEILKQQTLEGMQRFASAQLLGNTGSLTRRSVNDDSGSDKSDGSRSNSGSRSPSKSRKS